MYAAADWLFLFPYRYLLHPAARRQHGQAGLHSIWSCHNPNFGRTTPSARLRPANAAHGVYWRALQQQQQQQQRNGYQVAVSSTCSRAICGRCQMQHTAGC
jgi:hypothetical protein